MHSDWLKLVAWLATFNHTSLSNNKVVAVLWTLFIKVHGMSPVPATATVYS